MSVAAALLAVLAALGLWPFGVAGCLVLLVVTWYQAVVTLTVDAREVLVGQGRGKRGLRDILVRNIVLYEVTRFGWRDAFGSAPAPASNTYVVRAGAGLRLVLNDDETLNISAVDPDAAAAVLRAAGVREAPRVTRGRAVAHEAAERAPPQTTVRWSGLAHRSATRPN